MIIRFRDRSLLACALCCVLHASVATGAVLGVKLVDVIPADGNSEVKLNIVDVGPADPGADVAQAISRARTTNSRYSLVLTAIEHVDNQPFFTYQFLAWDNNRSGDKTRVVVTVKPTGSFPDFEQGIPFTIFEAGREVGDGAIDLPFHPVDPQSLCAIVDGIVPIPTVASPLRVFLGEETKHIVAVSCSKSTYFPRILSIDNPIRKASYWSVVNYQSDYFDPTKPAKAIVNKAFDLLTVNMTPNVLSAIGSRFRRFSLTDEPDDTIVLNVAYAMQNGGLSTPLRVAIPVSFFPSPAVTAVSLLIGVATGLLVSFLLVLSTSRGKPIKIVHALLLGPLLAVIAFTLSVLAYSAKCRLEVFGLNVNPFDVLVLFAMGLVCGFVAVLKTDELLTFINRTLKKIKPGAAMVIVTLLGSLSLPPIADAADFTLIGLSACDDGDVLALDRNGTVIHFRSTQPGVWRRAGRVSPSMSVVEVVCATLDGKRTAFVVANASQYIRIIRMDVTSGKWSVVAAPIAGTAASVTFDAKSNSVYVSSIKDRSVYRMEASASRATQWTSLFSASTIGAVTVDPVANRLLVGEGFAGTIYAIDLASRKQQTVAEGVGSANSLAVDRLHRLLYIADQYRRAVWVVPLAGGSAKPRKLYGAETLKSVSGVAVDGQSNIWISLQDLGRVLIVNPSGRVVRDIR